MTDNEKISFIVSYGKTFGPSTAMERFKKEETAILVIALQRLKEFKKPIALLGAKDGD
jgi:hypothetical protein